MDPISDMLIRIKNAQMVKNEHVWVPFSRVKFKIAEILKNGDFISGFEKKKRKVKKTEHDYIFIDLKYDNNGSAISDVKIVSRQSRRMYVKAKDIKPVRSGYGLAVLSTPKGIMSSKEARKNNLGGELMFEIW